MNIFNCFRKKPKEVDPITVSFTRSFGESDHCVNLKCSRCGFSHRIKIDLEGTEQQLRDRMLAAEQQLRSTHQKDHLKWEEQCRSSLQAMIVARKCGMKVDYVSHS